MTPEKVVLVLLAPVLRVTEPAALLVTVPAPASEPMVSLKPARSRVRAGGDGDRAAGAMALATPSPRVPALIVVAPV